MPILCGSFLDPQLEHRETCSTTEATRGITRVFMPLVCGMKLVDPGITTEPRGAQLRNPGRLRYSHHRCCPQTQRGPGRVRGPPLQRQPAEMLHRRHSIVNCRITETKLWPCENRAFTIALPLGQRMDDRTQP